ncbi:MAG: DUF5916 domain-containing protein, partial [Gemmatimonadaceae bacterium]
NFWTLDFWGFYQPETADDRLLRGGPNTRKPAEWQLRMGVRSDSRRAALASLYYEGNFNAQNEWRHTLEANVEVRPTSAARFRIGPTFTRQFDVDQYVAVIADPLATTTFGQRWLFGDITESELSVQARAEWTFSPTLTLQLWAQPFIASGHFLRYKEFITPGQFAFDVYGTDRGTISRGTGASSEMVTIDPDGSGAAPAFTIAEQDFLVRSVRGNAVLRWEYRPGSTVFLVWQQQRNGASNIADLNATHDVTSAFRDPARNVFLVKLSYWLGR